MSGAAAVCAAPLQRGARIYCPGEGPGLADRLHLSCGTRAAADRPDLAAQYGTDTFVPRGPWRRPSAGDVARLRGERPGSGAEWRPGADVAILRLPDALSDAFRELLDRPASDAGGDPGVVETLIANDPCWSRRYAALRRYLERFCEGRAPPAALLHGLFRTEKPDRFTLASTDDGKLAGLHVDSGDGLPFRHRARSRNRMSVNLGRGPRYSLFVNLTLSDIFQYLGLRDPEDVYADYRGLSLGRRFLKHCPAYPVIRLRVDPGEAYILPADNLIHDASTEGTIVPDVTLSYLGHFTPGHCEGFDQQ